MQLPVHTLGVCDVKQMDNDKMSKMFENVFTGHVGYPVKFD